MYRSPRYECQRNSRYFEYHVRGFPLIRVGSGDSDRTDPGKVEKDAGRLSRIDLTVTSSRLTDWLSHPVMSRVDILRVSLYDAEDQYDPVLWKPVIMQLAEYQGLSRLEELNVWVYGGYMHLEDSESYRLVEDVLAPLVRVSYDH